MLCNHWYNLKSHLRLSNILYYVVGCMVKEWLSFSHNKYRLSGYKPLYVSPESKIKPISTYHELTQFQPS